MKRKLISILVALVLVLGFSLVTAVPAMAATITEATGGESISADTAADADIPAWTTLTGPIITEASPADLIAGTIVFTAPAGFEFNPAQDVTAVVSGGGTQLTLDSLTATPAATTITFTVDTQSSVSASIITFSDIQVRPTNGADLASGDIVVSGTAGASGNAGALATVVGALAAYLVVPEEGPYVAGTAFDVVVTAVDQFDTPLGAEYAPIDLTFIVTSTADNAPDLTPPVIGTLEDTDFAVDVATIAATLYCAENGVTFTVTDDGVPTTGTSVGIDVGPDVLDALVMVDEPADPTDAGAPIGPVTVMALDQYLNPIESVSIDVTEAGAYVFNEGTLTQLTGTDGIATFDDLSIYTPGVGYQLHFASGLITVDSAPFDVVPSDFDADISTLEVDETTVTAGDSVAVTVTPQDAFGNLLGTGQVVVVLLDGVAVDYDGAIAVTDEGDGTYTAGVRVTDTSALNIISATVGGVPITNTEAITVNHDVLAAYLVEPAAGPYVAGTAFNIVVTAVDQFGNPLGADYNPTGLTFTVTSTANDAPDGISTPVIGPLLDTNFAGGAATIAATLYCAENGVTFTVTDDTITGTSVGIDVDPDVLAYLVIVDEPGETAAGEPIGPVTVIALDLYLNPIESVSIDVTEAGAYVFNEGTLTQLTGADGIATFDDLAIYTAGVGYQLHFASVLITVDSAPFDVVPSYFDPVVSTLEVDSDTVIAGDSVAVTVTPMDAFGNLLGAGQVVVVLLDGVAVDYDGAIAVTDLLNGTYTASVRVTDTSAGNIISATVGGFSVDGFVDIFVDPGEPAGIIILPDDATITGGDTQAYTATTCDEFGNDIGDDVTVDTDFSIEEGAGGSWVDNVYTSAFAGELWTVTGNFEGLTGTATLTVTPGPVHNINSDKYYLEIQVAIDDADPGDTITVAAGTYTENLNIDKSLTLLGAGADVTEIDVDGEDEGIIVYLGYDDEDAPLAETVVIDGFYINDAYYDLIWLEEVNNGSSVTISNCILEDCDYGIYCGDDTLDGGSTVTIIGNEIYGAEEDGIYIGEVTDGSALNIVDNYIYDNDDGYGVYIDEVSDGSTVTIIGNTIGEWYDDEWDEWYDGNYYGGIYINDVYDSTVTIGGDTEAEGNTIIGNAHGDGIQFDYAENSIFTIEGNRINFNGWDSSWGRDGIEFEEIFDGNSIAILNNDILGNTDVGIQLGTDGADGSNIVVINYNSIVGNEYYGIRVDNEYITVDATRNWWGDVAGPRDDGPSIYINPYQLLTETNGDHVYGYITYSPWLIQSELEEGWNIVSWPIAPDQDSLSQLQADLIEAGVDAIYYFDSETQLWGPDPNDANPMDAFYIKMQTPVTIRYFFDSEATFPAQKAMRVGWNFIGLAQLYAVDTPDALLDIFFGTGGPIPGYSKVICPSLNGVSWTYLVGGDGTGAFMQPTKGYWVFMVNDGVLGGFTTTPIVEVPGP